MDTQRLILFFVFSFSLLMLWQAWQKESQPQPPAPAVGGSAPPVPAPTTAKPSAPGAAGAGVPPGAAAVESKRGERLRVQTDTVVAEIDTLGGDLVYLELLQHKDTLDQKKNLVLLGPEHRYAAQSGLIGND